MKKRLLAMCVVAIAGGIALSRYFAFAQQPVGGASAAPAAQPQIGTASKTVGGRAAANLSTGRGGGGRRGLAPMDPISQKRLEEMRRPLQRLTPVTQEMLENPSPNDWLMWRRDYHLTGFSPLTQINRDNVKNVRSVWTLGLTSGANEFEPLVHDGIMFIWDYGDRIQALNATNGDVLWQYRHQVPADLTGPDYHLTKKHLGIHGNKLLFATTDLHLIALDMKTGNVIYDDVVDDYKRTQYTYNTGPVVIKDKVLLGMGNTLGYQYGGALLTGHDVETGKELWRFHSVALPGEPGGDTWNNLPADKRFGGSFWTSGSYDPELNTTYWGTGQAYPWDQKSRGTAVPPGQPLPRLLYTTCTLALDPDTGKLKWYFSHLPNDNWDEDYAFERIIAPVQQGNVTRKTVVTVGKIGIMEMLDAAEGQFLGAKDMGVQNTVLAVDQKTGEKTFRPIEEVDVRCPPNNGAKNWPSGAFSPMTHIYYFTMNENCVGSRMLPSTPDGKIGRLDAVNLDTRQEVWQFRDRSAQPSAVLATAGGLVFAGSYDRYLRAFDDRTGAVLWQTRLQDIVSTFPITYAVDGKQYIAISVGSASIYGAGLGGMHRELQMTTPPPTTVLWIFALP
jgi:alcohol dehydrogenase (cytochrome c)